MPSTLDNLIDIVRKAIADAPLGKGFSKAMEAAITKAHTAAYIAAATERIAAKTGTVVKADFFKGLSRAERSEIKTAVAGQMEYLQKFVDESEGMSEAAIRARAQLYAGAVKATYGRSRYPGLSQYPGDGSTQCRTNCLCSLESRDDGIYWVLDGGEHCDDCVALAAGSPYDSGKDEGT